MSKTHKKKAAKKLADSLEIPYQRALDAIEEAIGSAYPPRSSVRDPDLDPEQIPMIYSTWVDYLHKLTALSDSFVSRVSQSDLQLEELESLVVFDRTIFKLIDEIDKVSPHGHDRCFNEFIDRAVVLTASGEFPGYQYGEFFKGDIFFDESIWSAMVRNGFAENIDPSIESDGPRVVWTDLGIDTFVVPNTDVWNEKMFFLFEPVLDREEKSLWLQEIIDANEQAERENQFSQ